VTRLRATSVGALSRICKQGPNVPEKKHRILVKDMISKKFLNVNEKKQGPSNSGRYICLSCEYRDVAQATSVNIVSNVGTAWYLALVPLCQ